MVQAGVRFLGATMWTDFAATGNPPMACMSAQNSMNDFRQILTENYRRIRPADLVAQSVQTKDWLRLKLAEPFDGPTVVITHHAPTLRSLQGNPHAGTHMDAAYANRWEDLLGSKQMALWLHGHSHMAADYDVGGHSDGLQSQGVSRRRDWLSSELNHHSLAISQSRPVANQTSRFRLVGYIDNCSVPSRIKRLFVMRIYPDVEPYVGNGVSP